MAQQLTKEEIDKVNEELKKYNATPKLSTESYRANLESLGKETKYDYLRDYDKLKNSLLDTSYSPYTKKTYSYEEKQKMTEEDYYNDLMAAANYTEPFTDWKDVHDSWERAQHVMVATGTSTSPLSVMSAPFVADTLYKALNTREGKAFAYGVNEIDGGTALYKAIYGEDALKKKLNQVENVYNRGFARGLGSTVGIVGLTYAGGALGSTIGGALGTAAGLSGNALNTASAVGAIGGRTVAGGTSGGLRAYTYSNDPVDIAAGTASGSAYGLLSGLTSAGLKSAITSAYPQVTSKLGTDIALNAGTSAAGAYAGTAGSGTLGNAIRAAGGKEVTPEEWISPLWSWETLGNVGAAGVIGGALGTYGDRASWQGQSNSSNTSGMTKEEAYKILGLKDNPSEADIRRAANKLVFAYHSDTGGETADTQKLNEVLAAKRFLQEYKPGVFERVKNVFVKLANSTRVKTNTSTTGASTSTGPLYLPAGSTGTQTATPSTQLIPTTGAATPNTTTGASLIPTGDQPTTTTQPTGATPIIPNAVPTTNTMVGSTQPSLSGTANVTQPKINGNEKQNEVMSFRYGNGDYVEVIKNPTEQQEDEMRKEARAKYSPNYLKQNPGEPLLRRTYDNEGNVYRWQSIDGTHYYIENFLKDKYPDKQFNQNQFFDKKTNGSNTIAEPSTTLNQKSKNVDIANQNDTLDLERGEYGDDGDGKRIEGDRRNDTNETGVASSRLGIQQGGNRQNVGSLRNGGKADASKVHALGKVLKSRNDNKTDNTINNPDLQSKVNNRLKHKKYTDWENEAYVLPSGKIVRFAEHKDDVVGALSMKDAGKMFERAFATYYPDGTTKYSNYRDWLSKEEPSKIANAVLKNGLLKAKYISSSKALEENPELLRAVVGAYRNGELIGKEKKIEYDSIDRTKEGNYGKNPYKYQPKKTSDRRDAEELLRVAKGTNVNEANEAKAEFIINSHDSLWLKKSGMSQAEANDLIAIWGANYSEKANRTIKELNAGVSSYNKWTGIENSNILNMATISTNDLEKFGLTLDDDSVKAHPDLLKYIANTILALDTHQSWHGLNVLIETDKFDGKVRGELLPDGKTIDIYLNGPQTVSHEMGHWLDRVWGHDIALYWLQLPRYDFLTNRLEYDFLEKVSPFQEATDFIKHFYSFMDDIAKTANTSTDYLQRESEIFARFFAEFIKWTSNLAGNDIMENDINFVDREEKFTIGQFKEFVKLLQEKSAVTALIENNPRTKYSEFERQLSYGNNGDKISDFLKEEFLKSNTPKTFVENIEKDKYKKLGEELSNLIVKDNWFQNSFERVYDRLTNKGISADNPIETTIDILQTLRGSIPVKAVDSNYGIYQKSFAKSEKPLKKAPKPAPEPPKNYTIEKQNEDIKKLEDAANKLRDQLAKKEEELKKAREQGKQALKKQKDESREKIRQLTFKKDEQRQEALRDARLKGKESLRKQRERLEAKKRAADQDKRAKTMPQKFDLAYDRLQDALDKIYDKPVSKEMEKALKEVQKNSRGTIKLLDKVKKILPSKYNFFADDVLDIVETYYTGGNKMTDEKRASLEQKAKLIQDFIDQNPNFPISDRAKALLKEPNKKNIADLNERDLVSLAEDIQEIGIAVRDMFSFVRASEDAIKFREGALEYAQKMLAAGKGRKPVAKGYRLVEGARKYLDKRSTLKTMTLRLSGGNPYAEFNFIPNQLLAGYADYNKALDKLLKPWEKYTTYKKFGNVRKVSNKLDYLWNPKNRLKYGLKTLDGGTYHPSLRYAILVVYASQDPQFAGHTIGYLTDKFEDVIDDETGEPTGEKRPIKTKGGIARFANSIDEQFGETNKGLKRGVSVKLSIDDVNKMREELIKMPYVKEFLDTMKEFSDINYGLVNPTHEAINGQSLPKRDFYTPIRVDPAVRSRQKAIDDVKARTNIDGTTTLLNSGFVQPIVEGADGQILIYPMDEVIGKMMNNAALYAGYAARLYDINTFLNATTEDGKSLVELINELDPSYIGNYNKVAESIVVGNRRNLTSELASRYTNSILRANPWLALKQAGSYFTTAKYYDHPLRSMLAGAFNKKGIAKAIKEAYKAHGTDIDKLNVDETIRYFWDDKINAELSIRARGWNSPDKYDILKHAGLLKRLKILDLYKGVDYSTVRAIAFAMVKDSMIDGKFDFDNDATFDELNNKFLAAHTETQPNTSAVTRAPIQNGNVADKILSFMKDPVIKEGNALADARMIKKWANKEGTKEQKQEANKGYWRAIVGTLASLAYITYVNNRKKTVEGKEDNNFIKDMIANGIALTVGVDQIAGALINEYSYDITAPDTQALNMLYNIGKTLRDVKDHWGDSYKLSKDADKIVEYLASFCGIPYKNLKTSYNDLLSLTGSSEYYMNKIKSDTNMYEKYQKYEDDIYDPEEFYEIYKATREKVIKEEYGKYNNATIKQAISDAGGDVSTYYKMFKLGK